MCSSSMLPAAVCLPVSRSVSQSVSLSVDQAAQVPLSSCVPDPNPPPVLVVHPAGFGTHHAAVITRQSCRGCWEKPKQTKRLTLCLCLEKDVPPRRNVCCQPGTGPDRRAEPNRSRSGPAEGRDPAAADRIRHPGLIRDAQPGPVSPEVRGSTVNHSHAKLHSEICAFKSGGACFSKFDMKPKESPLIPYFFTEYDVSFYRLKKYHSEFVSGIIPGKSHKLKNCLIFKRGLL